MAKQPKPIRRTESQMRDAWKEMDKPILRAAKKGQRLGYDAGTSTITYNPKSVYENIKNPAWLAHEMEHHKQKLRGEMHYPKNEMLSRPNPKVASGLAMKDYYNRREADLQTEVDSMVKKNPELQFVPKEKLIKGTPANSKGIKSFVGAEDRMYDNPRSLEGRARVVEDSVEAAMNKPKQVKLIKKNGTQRR